MRKTILHITYSTHIGGAERAVFQLIKGQREVGITADLLVVSVKSFYGKKVCETGAKVFELGMKRGLSLPPLKRFRQIISQYDIVHFHVPNPFLMYLASRTDGNSRLYYTHRGGVFDYPFRRRLVYQLSKIGVKRSFSGVSANTKHAALSVSRLFNMHLSKIFITYNGIDFSLLEPKRRMNDVLKEVGDSKGNVIRIGTTSKLRELKRTDYLLKSVAEFKNLPIHCYVIGDGPARQGLERLSNALDITNLVTFTGEKEHVGDYLQLIDIFVLPSNTNESFGNSVVEAMGLGIPSVVMSDGGGMVEHMVQGGGFIAKNQKDLTDIIRKLFQSEELRNCTGENGRKYVMEKYSIKKMVKAYNDFYACPRIRAAQDNLIS